MTSAFENLAGPGKQLRAEPPDVKEFEGLYRMGLERQGSPGSMCERGRESPRDGAAETVNTTDVR